MDAVNLPDRYTIISELGSGAMGTVYKVQDANLDRVLAIKVLKLAAVDQNPKLVPRFQIEAQAAGRLQHENLIGVVDFGLNEDGLPYLVMEYIEGDSLKQLLDKEKILPVSQTIDIFLQIASAMEHAHNHGVIHRDLKPANVVANPFGRWRHSQSSRLWYCKNSRRGFRINTNKRNHRKSIVYEPGTSPGRKS